MCAVFPSSMILLACALWSVGLPRLAVHACGHGGQAWETAASSRSGDAAAMTSGFAGRPHRGAARGACWRPADLPPLAQLPTTSIKLIVERSFAVAPVAALAAPIRAPVPFTPTRGPPAR